MLQIFNVYLNLPAFLLVLFRVSSFFLSSPIFGDKAISSRIRIIFSIVITLVVLPTLSKLPSVAVFSYDMITMALQQIFIGIASGFVFNIVFQVFLYSGQIISLQTGLGFATLMDPGMGSINMLSRFYWIAIMLVFVSLNGHLMLINMLVHSFKSIPLTETVFMAVKSKAIISFSGTIFSEAVSIALPAIISLLLVNFTFAVMTRAAPSFNIFTVGFPITLLLGLFIAYLTFYQVMAHSDGLFSDGFKLVSDILGGAS